MSIKKLFVYWIWVSLLLTACNTPNVETAVSTTEPNDSPTATATAVVNTPNYQLAPSTINNNPQLFAQVNDIVSLSQGSQTWETYAYELEDDLTIVPGSFDGKTTMLHTFDRWIMENKYLKVTLLPEFGGRILSIIYKPTGHEQLYQNPIGVPYLIDRGIFYYDWLMIYGGIFPTFPEPEHGKTWFLPWNFEIVEETAEKVTIMMSFIDDINIAAAPGQYDVGQSGVAVNFYVSLQAGRAAVDTRIELTNTTGSDTALEYWTNASLAPGSDPDDPFATEDAVIVAPFQEIHVPNFYDHIAVNEQRTRSNGVYQFDALREYRNWPDEGIAYAYPDLGGTTFWGVINQKNREGLIRIADNSITEGLKIWTFGYPQSAAINPYRSTDYDRPMIELWAGITPEFWIRDQFEGNETLVIEESYAPTLGMQSVTHANHNLLLNMVIRDHEIWGEMFSPWPDTPLTISVRDKNGHALSQASLGRTGIRGNRFRIPLPENATELRFEDEAGTIFLSNEILPVSK